MALTERVNTNKRNIATNAAAIAVNAAAISALGVPLQFKGTIAAAANFPTAALVQSGWTYRVTADVTDDDATKTNTGQSFMALTEIAWNGTDWTPLGTEVTATYVAATPATLTVGDVLAEVDTVTIGGASVLNLPALTDSQVGKVIVVSDTSGGAATDNIAVTPDGTDEINGVNAAVSLDRNYGTLILRAVQTGAATYGWVTEETPASLTNTINIATIMDKLVRVTITATGGTGGATAGTISVQVSNLDGVAISRAVNLRLDSSLTQFGGSAVATGTAFFGAASTGTLVAGSGALSAIVTTDATGLYEGALADAADEVAYFSAQTAPGGAASNAAGCIVAECVPDSAEWTA